MLCWCLCSPLQGLFQWCASTSAPSLSERLRREASERLQREEAEFAKATKVVDDELTWVNAAMRESSVPHEEYKRYERALASIKQRLDTEHRMNVMSERMDHVCHAVSQTVSAGVSEGFLFGTNEVVEDTQRSGGVSSLQRRLLELSNGQGGEETEVGMKKSEVKQETMQSENRDSQNGAPSEAKQQNSFRCCICMTAPPCIAFQPCWHVCVCVACCGDLLARNNDAVKCPMCRTPVLNLQAVYL